MFININYGLYKKYTYLKNNVEYQANTWYIFAVFSLPHPAPIGFLAGSFYANLVFRDTLTLALVIYNNDNKLMMFLHT